MDKSVGQFLDNLIDKFGDDIRAIQDGKKVEVISTGSLALDICTGVGGIPKGRFTEIFGSAGVGKTTLCLSLAGSAIKDGGRVLYLDAENTLSISLVKEVIPEADENNNFIILNPLTLDDAFDAVISGVESELFDLVIFDSLPALPSEEELEKGMGKDVMMVLPRMAGKFLRLSAVKVRSSKTAIVIINQVRDDTKSFVGGYRTTGGHAVKHFNSLEIALTKGKPIEDGDKKIGTYTNFVIRKNKVGIPFRSAQLPIIFGRGVDYIRDTIEFSTLIGVTKRKGAYYYFEDTNLGQGLNNACETLRNNEEMLRTIVSASYNAVVPGLELSSSSNEKDLTKED